jgi:hypothetical protein
MCLRGNYSIKSVRRTVTDKKPHLFASSPVATHTAELPCSRVHQYPTGTAGALDFTVAMISILVILTSPFQWCETAREMPLLVWIQ